MKLTENQFPKDNHFKVPEKYFEMLPLNIQDRIAEKASRKYWFFSIKEKTVLALITVVGIVVISTIFFLREPHSENQDLISYSMEYVLNSHYIYDIDEALIAEFISENSSTSDSLSGEIDYLLNNRIELQILIEEL